MRTIPERPETIAVQIRWLVEGKRLAVLLTPGCAVPEVPLGVEACVTAVGIFLYWPGLVTPGVIRWYVAEAWIGELLGYGVPRKPAPAEIAGVVVLRGENGREKQSVVVGLESAADAWRAAHDLAEPGDTVRIERPETVLRERLKAEG